MITGLRIVQCESQLALISDRSTWTGFVLLSYSGVGKLNCILKSWLDNRWRCKNMTNLHTKKLSEWVFIVYWDNLWLLYLNWSQTLFTWSYMRIGNILGRSSPLGPASHPTSLGLAVPHIYAQFRFGSVVSVSKYWHVSLLRNIKEYVWCLVNKSSINQPINIFWGVSPYIKSIKLQFVFGSVVKYATSVTNRKM